MRNSSITRLVIGTAFAVGMSVVAISAIGGAVAKPPVERTQEALSTQRSRPSISGTPRLSDRQQLKGYFLDGSQYRFR